jgi:hypothetical protein
MANEIDPAIDLGLRHFMVAAKTSGYLAGDGFDAGRHGLSSQADFCHLCDSHHAAMVGSESLCAQIGDLKAWDRSAIRAGPIETPLRQAARRLLNTLRS